MLFFFIRILGGSMKNKTVILSKFLLFGFFLLHSIVLAYNNRPPRLTVVLVIDQCAYAYFNKLMPFFKHGLKYLAEHGVVYTNCHQDNGQPGTATGHANLNTGVAANYHGLVSNSWYQNGIKVECDEDKSLDALVIDPYNGDTYDYGKSAKHLMVDGLSDQFVLHSQPGKKCFSYSISGKSRSAIATAGKLGKAVWFDNKRGMFTSSKAYFNELPEWLESFNHEHRVSMFGSVRWKLMYPRNPYAYNFFNINNYQCTRMKKSMLDRELLVPDVTNSDNKYELFEKTPHANQLILDCARSCIKEHVSRKHRDSLLLWVCLSPLDKVAHQFGPNNIEAIDMMYHLDKQIQRFMRQTLRIIGKHEVLFTLTADHAVMPIPEILHEQGLTQARRISRNELIDMINKKISAKYSVDDMVMSYKGQELILNPKAVESLKSEDYQDMLYDVKLCLLQEVGIKSVWTYDELISVPTQPHTLEDNIKKQLFKGRSGQVILQTYPYTVITNWPEGASHKTPYNYDTHIPLIIFNAGKFERRYVRSRVSAIQLPNTLAEILNIQKPSASVCEILPELFDPEYQ